MNQNDCSGKTLKPWPVFVDHFKKHIHLLNGIVMTLKIRMAQLFAAKCLRKLHEKAENLVLVW